MSKFCSTTALREEIRWKRASEVVFCHLRYGVRMGSFVIGEEYTQSIQSAKHPLVSGHVAEQRAAPSVA